MAAEKAVAMQVRMRAELLEGFREYARRRGETMSGLVVGWIEGALGGVVDVSSAGSGGGSEVLSELRVQTGLLRQLVNSGSGGIAEGMPTPGRGEERLPVVIDEPLGVSSETEIEESGGSLIEWRRVVRGMDEPVAPPAGSQQEWVQAARDWLLDQGIAGGSGAIGELLEFWGAPEVGDGELKEALGELEAYEPLD